LFRIRLISTPDNIERLRTRGPQIIEALTRKMTELMFRLQSHIVGETIPQFFKSSSNIAATVRAIPATLEGTTIVGAVEAGGPRTTKITLRSGAEVDYAAVQEVGVPHSYQILPFTKKALAFILNEKLVIARSVTHPGLRARPFMYAGLQDLEGLILHDLEQEVLEQLT
jgi:hypothetical protein